MYGRRAPHPPFQQETVLLRPGLQDLGLRRSLSWVAARAPSPPSSPLRDGRLVWTTIRPAVLTIQVCSLQLISLPSMTARLPWWRSAYAAYALLMSTFIMGMGLAYEYRSAARRRNRFGRYASFISYLECVVLVELWVRAAPRWPGLWARVDDLEGRLWGRGVRRLPRLRRQTLNVACVFLLVSIPQQAFLVWRRLPLLDLFSLGQLLCGLCTSGVFNFSSMALMVLSDVVAECFRALTAKVRCTAKQSGNLVPPQTVEDVRVLYNDVCRLTRALDGCVGGVLLVTLFSDGLFICQFVLISLTSTTQSSFAVPTLLIVVARFFFTMFIASSVHNEWLATKASVLRMSTYKGDKEVLRFFMQIATDRVSLTALKIISITRPLILAVLGSLLSCEIILVQFNRG